MNFLTNMFVKNHFAFILILWSLTGIITLFITDPLVNDSLKHFFKTNANIFILITICYFLITMVIIFISVLNGEKIHLNIITELLLCRGYIQESGSVNTNQLTGLFRYWNSLTYPFQNYIINNNIINIDVISAEIKNHVMKCSILWKFLRTITGCLCYFFNFSMVYFFIDKILNNSLSTFYAIKMVVLNCIFFFLHFYFCGYFQRKKIYSNKLIAFISPWEYSENISVNPNTPVETETMTSSV
ncbi:hypothetical protein JCM39194_25240 [Desulfotomaculum varum]